MAKQKVFVEDQKKPIAVIKLPNYVKGFIAKKNLEALLGKENIKHLTVEDLSVWQPVTTTAPAGLKYGKDGDQCLVKFANGAIHQGYFTESTWFYSMVDKRYIHLPKKQIVSFMVIPL